jgi:hypothetical protein
MPGKVLRNDGSIKHIGELPPTKLQFHSQSFHKEQHEGAALKLNPHPAPVNRFGGSGNKPVGGGSFSSHFASMGGGGAMMGGGHHSFMR